MLNSTALSTHPRTHGLHQSLGTHGRLPHHRVVPPASSEDLEEPLGRRHLLGLVRAVQRGRAAVAALRARARRLTDHYSQCDHLGLGAHHSHAQIPLSAQASVKTTPRVHPSLFLPRRIEEGEARVAHAVRDLRQRRGIKQMQSRNRVLTSSHTPPPTSIRLHQLHMRSNDSPRCKAGSSKFTGARRSSRSSLPVNRTPPASSAAISNSMKRLSAGASQRNGTRIGTPVLRSFCNST